MTNSDTNPQEYRRRSFISSFSNLMSYNGNNSAGSGNDTSVGVGGAVNIYSDSSSDTSSLINSDSVSVAVAQGGSAQPVKQSSQQQKTKKQYPQAIVSSASFHQATAPSSLNDLIPLMNKLQDVFSTIGHEHIDLPQIVVVGSQSSGKSSVLENIIQKDFLPRGKDIVTRRPLILQLVQLPESQNEQWAEFLHLPGQKFTDFSVVRQEIEQETVRVAGNNKGIARQPINLKIFSNKVLNLTLVDLPGIMKVPIGDQPADIELRIRRLILEYIAKPNAVILAVSPANQDIANSDALKLAREVDPDGKRTIGVLTKLDLMDKGTNAFDILIGKAYPLKLGFCAVVNRSQDDINKNLPISKALQTEKDFFKSHSAYSSMQSKCGTAHLVRTLNMILIQHIKEKLPKLKAKLNLLVMQTEQELYSYGDPLYHGKAHQGTTLLRLLTKFSVNFVSAIDGTYSDLFTQELSGGARLFYIFNSIFGQTLASIDPCAGLSVQDIRTAIRNASGPRASLFVPEQAFDLLIKPQIRKLEVPALKCVELVFDELLKIISSCENKELARFPLLHQRVVEASVQLLKDRMNPTQQYIASLVDIQLSYINTNHPDFIGGSAAIAQIERKHQMRKLEQDRNRKQMQLSSGIAFAQGVGDHAESSARSHSRGKQRTNPVDYHSAVGRSVSPVPYGHSNQQQQQQYGGSHSQSKDGGFLTYFFGQHSAVDVGPDGARHNTAPMRSDMVAIGRQSRSNSPSRQLLSADEAYERRSDDGIQSVLQPEKEDLEVELIKALIHSYFNIVRKSIADLVPKAVMHMMVNFGRENMQSHLVTSLYKEDLFNQLLMEDERIVEERKQCMQLLDTYRKGASVLQDIFQIS
ncbi:hypothetical protein MP228_004960 [Amoeboaphelidium protococcarum]|nr:hypothetical protein MP228_004960 [Amoeboaphelidium protococcarum]